MKNTVTTRKNTSTALKLSSVTCGDCPFTSYDPTIDRELFLCGLSYDEGKPVNPRRVIFIPTLDSRPRHACPMKRKEKLARQFFPQFFSPSRPKGIC